MPGHLLISAVKLSFKLTSSNLFAPSTLRPNGAKVRYEDIQRKLLQSHKPSYTLLQKKKKKKNVSVPYIVFYEEKKA